MNKNLKKIAVILFLVIILPAAVFLIYEISTLSESEEVIERIYINQLDAILYSVNQYSEDITSSWNNKISSILTNSNNDNSYRKEIDKFLKENSSIEILFITDNINDKSISVYSGELNFNNKTDEINKLLSANKETISKLSSYLKTGYRKLQPVENNIIENSSSLLFLAGNISGEKICGIIFNPRIFIQQTLAPKIQSIAQNEFIISVYDSLTKDIIYSTEDGRIEDLQQSKSLWLLPDYNLGIQLKGETIEQLAKQRSFTNIILVTLLVIVLAAGVIFVFRSIKKEVELAQIKSDFVSNVSHELRTPLALINMFAETLELGRVKSEEKRQEYYSIISRETGRLSRIVNKILSFSQIEAGRKKYNFSKTNLNEIVEKVLDTYRFHLEKNGFNYQFIKDENLPSINADSEAAAEAFINLLDNAVKYSKEKKEIEIKTLNDKDTVSLEVTDSGLGISQEDQKKIFDKFYRVSSGLVHNTKGTGLGLTLVKHIMDAHKGEVILNSTLGKGSTFKLIFPLNEK